MGIVIHTVDDNKVYPRASVITITCDRCGAEISGQESYPTFMTRAVKAGWTERRLPDGERQFLCPRCKKKGRHTHVVSQSRLSDR
jgi:uncharacterized C2H2 Zn-finger protein